MKSKRTFTEVVKKRIAASQCWRCSRCDDILESTYQVDHTIPLWAGGDDVPENATAMCVACHARKTQEEALSRTEMERAERRRIRERFENDVRREEEERRIEDREKDGTATCRDCGARYYPLFPHTCVEVERRCSRRLIGRSADSEKKKEPARHSSRSISSRGTHDGSKGRV